MKKESGFTLIEVIVTLILVGVMAAVAGLGIVTAVNGYLFVKENTVIAGKAQVALARMTRELTDLRDIPSPSTNARAASVVFAKVSDTVAIGQSGTEIKIAKGNPGTTPDYATGDVLVDQVATGGLSLAYKKGSVNWTSSDDITDLSHIVITLTMSGAGEGSNFTFNTAVNPRNNGNAGGAPPPTPLAPPPSGGGRCFVATAAYGNPYHPMVLLLKQFRDQYLSTWPGGRALVQFYYKKGPYLAEMIHDKPWASGFARALLLPFVGLSFLLVYARGSIPLVILILMVGIWLIKRYPMRSTFIKKSMATHREKGSVLIGLIVTMVIMSFLGAAMVSLTSTSGLNQAYGATSQKAYYLAESGFRYAGSEFLNVTDNENNGKNENQNSKANDLNGRTLTLAEGSIRLNVTPFHYATSAAAAVGATTLSVRFPGGTPAGFAIPSTGSIRIQTQYRPNSAATTYTTYTDTYNYSAFNASASTFTLGAGLVRAVPAWTSVTVMARPSAAQNNIIPNPDPTLTTNRLTLTKPATGFFMPQRNGKFKIPGNAVVYKYDYRDPDDGNSTTTTLYGVSNSQTSTNRTPFSVTTASSIIPTDFFTVASVGTVGNVSRTLNYITPIDIVSAAGAPAQKTTSADSFTAGVNPGATESHWYAPTAGSHSVSSSVSGGSKSDGTTGMAALRLTGSSNYGDNWWNLDKYFSLIALKWDQNYANFFGTWYSHDQTLSYDAQVKIELPQQNYYMAGLVFRLNLGTSGQVSDTSWLGVSFLRGRNGTSSGSDRDGIEDGVVPLDNAPMIVLWQKNTGDDLTGMQWIAYKIISGTMIFNDGRSPYFADGTNSYYIRGGASGARANVTSVSTTDGGGTGSLAVSSVYSTFQANEELSQLQLQTPNTARVRNAISSTSIGFDRGRTGIAAGDIIVGRSSGAIARATAVNQTGGDWNGTTNSARATGTINIDQREGTFTTSDSLDVYRPASNHSAHFVSYESLSDILTTGTNYIKDWSTLLLRLEEKLVSGQYVNDIKIYVGDVALHGAPTGSPLDAARYANERWSNPPATDDVQWPPDEGWSSDLPGNLSKDHFTLVRGWVINSALSSSFALTGTTEEPNSTIRTNTFTTHGLGSFVQQEIGLQTAGAGMTNNTYFDDFGVQLEGSATGGESGFSTPLQY
jgi:prepilin-type N-terminal cleavage/methylation domain-containing protein